MCGTPRSWALEYDRNLHAAFMALTAAADAADHLSRPGDYEDLWQMSRLTTTLRADWAARWSANNPRLPLLGADGRPDPGWQGHRRIADD
jgi:hypothetical protein